MVTASEAQKGDTVLEIGPGLGALTRVLLGTGSTVISVEKDDRLIPLLKENFLKEVQSGQLQIIHADILTCDVGNILPKSYKVVANIPYYITGQVIRMFLETEKKPESMTLLVQKEVAERIVARDKKESLLSLSVKAYGTPKLVQKVPRGAFVPAPNVDSAIIHIADISRKNFKGSIEEKKFFTLLHAGFVHKRKQLLPNLSLTYKKDAVTSAFLALNLDLKCRAEDLSIETWLKLSTLIG